MDDETTAQINQLQQQQMFLTRALAAACAGRWQGEDSVEAWLYAIDPAFQGTLTVDPPAYDDA
jgi:hypothetical protein